MRLLCEQGRTQTITVKGPQAVPDTPDKLKRVITAQARREFRRVLPVARPQQPRW
jgi:hypothetical protein